MSAAKPKQIIEIFLQPGEVFFGDETTRIRTLLGSCVSITLWHPKRRIGGMCHYMLPSRGGGNGDGSHAPDGRYADEVAVLFERELAATRTKPGEYEVKLFGGGNMFPGTSKWPKRAATSSLSDSQGIAQKNIDAGRALMKKLGFRIKAEHVGGIGRRHIIFDIWSGHVWVRHSRDSDPA